MAGPDVGEGLTDTFTFHEIRQLLRRSGVFVRNLQQALELYIPKRGERYSEAYFRFLQKVIALRTFSVSVNDIRDLLTREKKILQLLNFDSISDSITWYLDGCTTLEHSERRLLLTGYDLGFPITGSAIQANLDFSEREVELFAGVEMGEDVRLVLRLYLELVGKIRGKVESETPVLKDALFWSEQVFHGTSE